VSSSGSRVTVPRGVVTGVWCATSHRVPAARSGVVIASSPRLDTAQASATTTPSRSSPTPAAHRPAVTPATGRVATTSARLRRGRRGPAVCAGRSSIDVTPSMLASARVPPADRHGPSD